MTWVGLGRTVLDRFTLTRPLGHGGVSLVYEAIDLDRMLPVAVKVLAPAFASNTRTCRAARQEPIIMQRLRHPSVPKVYGFGDAQLGAFDEVPSFAGRRFGGDGAVAMPCVVMELLDGVSLAKQLGTGRLPWRVAVETAATIAELLGVAHRRGIAHRDLTALNVMLTSNGVKIIDFGLATVVGARPFGLEMGQDVYALGVLLYQMLTGRSPYPSALNVADVRAVRPAPTPVFAGLGIPRTVAELCRDCMAKRAGDRPASADAAMSLWSALV